MVINLALLPHNSRYCSSIDCCVSRTLFCTRERLVLRVVGNRVPGASGSFVRLALAETDRRPLRKEKKGEGKKVTARKGDERGPKVPRVAVSYVVCRGPLVS